jgi:hypothetical protein
MQDPGWVSHHVSPGLTPGKMKAGPRQWIKPLQKGSQSALWLKIRCPFRIRLEYYEWSHDYFSMIPSYKGT